MVPCCLYTLYFRQLHSSVKTFLFVYKIQSNFDGSNLFGTMKICLRQRLFEPRKVTIGATPGGIMEIIVGYFFGVQYFKCMLCVLIRITSTCVYTLESPRRGDSNECTQHTFTR